MVIDLKLKLIHVECEGPKKSLKPKVKRGYYNSSRFGKVKTLYSSHSSFNIQSPAGMPRLVNSDEGHFVLSLALNAKYRE